MGVLDRPTLDATCYDFNKYCAMYLSMYKSTGMVVVVKTFTSGSSRMRARALQLFYSLSYQDGYTILLFVHEKVCVVQKPIGNN